MKLEKLDLKFFPNPTTDNLTLNLNDLEDVSIKIFNVNGELVYNVNRIQEEVYSFDFKFPSGVYIIEVETNKERGYSKFVKIENIFLLY